MWRSSWQRSDSPRHAGDAAARRRSIALLAIAVAGIVLSLRPSTAIYRVAYRAKTTPFKGVARIYDMLAAEPGGETAVVRS